MSHIFENIYVHGLFGGEVIKTHVRCTICKLEVVTYPDDNFLYDHFYFNGSEIYQQTNFAKLKDLPLTCNEFVIKNLLE